MGFSLGGSYGSTSSNSTSSGSQTPTYSGDQGGLQGSLASLFQTLLPGIATGKNPPNVDAVTTANADTINKSYSSLGDRMTKFLAARGFGSSGESGKTQLGVELGRQGSLAQNLASGAQQGLDYGKGLLQDALAFAFANPGQTSFARGSGSSSGFSIGGGVGGKF